MEKQLILRSKKQCILATSAGYQQESPQCDIVCAAPADLAKGLSIYQGKCYTQRDS